MDRKTKASLPHNHLMAARLSHIETRGFPPPSQDGFGFIIDQHHGDKRKSFGFIIAKDIPNRTESI
jgi:hypothetical protein